MRNDKTIRPARGAFAATMMLAIIPFRPALPGYRYEFPRDYFNHPEYRTEWWYYTGNVHTADGRHFGFELTFFRQGLGRDQGNDRDHAATNVWDAHDVWLAHLALSDIDGNRFLHTEKLNRSGPGLAGADETQSRVWNGNWQASWSADGQEHLQAVAVQFQFDLTLKPLKPPVIHGVDGISQKSEGAGHASHYFSQTRLNTQGTLTVQGVAYKVDGLAWMDHEFFTEQMAANLNGWDWFSLQLDDGSELMLYRMRRKDGTADPYSSGTYVDPTGRFKHLTRDAFELVPGKLWTSPASGGRYPIAWTIRIPSLKLDLVLGTRLADQELAGKSKASPVYWEGAIEVAGEKQGKAVTGAGYLEMTGYASAFQFAN
jgi:predicted secreted hydrolase